MRRRLDLPSAFVLLVPLLLGASTRVLAERPSRSTSRTAPRVVEEVIVDPKYLDRDLAQVTRDANARGRSVFIDFGAGWCQPCRELRKAFSRESNRELFKRWVLVSVNVDALPEGPVLGLAFDEIPYLVRLDGQGHPTQTLGGDALEDLDRPSRVDAMLRRFLAP